MRQPREYYRMNDFQTNLSQDFVDYTSVLKEELRCKILLRRLSEGKELENQEERRDSSSTSDEVKPHIDKEKCEERKLKNRLAVKNYRIKKMKEFNKLKEDLKRLNKKYEESCRENQRLKDEIEKLKKSNFISEIGITFSEENELFNEHNY